MKIYEDLLNLIEEFINELEDSTVEKTQAEREKRYKETFNKMNEANQIEEMKNLLKIYEKNKIIKNLHYDDSSKMFTFVYNYGEIKGALGGVSLKIWDPMMN